MNSFICSTAIHRSSLATIAGAVRLSSKWPVARRTLPVCFLDGDPQTHKLVAEVASAWNIHSGLPFDFPGVEYEVAKYDRQRTVTLPWIARSAQVANTECVIRVSFNLNGHWSYIGSDALNVQPGTATMSLAGVHAGMHIDDAKTIILHEFGHALGLIHEHQHPQNGILWNRGAVYADYVDGYGWTREQVDAFVFRALSETTLHAGAYDPDSIMHYSIPAHYTTNGFSVEWSKDLSEEDKRLIGEVYPSY